jgi:hypothetical protein
MKSFVTEYTSFTVEFDKLTVESINKPENIFINDGMSGAGNDYIFHKTLESISFLLEQNKKPDYVFIQWTGPNRRQHCTPKGRVINVNLYDNVECGIKFEPMGSEHTLHYMFTIQEYLKKENINYYFINYLGLDESIKNLNIFNSIDFTKILNFGLGYDVIYSGIIKYITENNLSCDNQGHPNEEGNYRIAEEIMNKLGFEIIKKKELFKNKMI